MASSLEISAGLWVRILVYVFKIDDTYRIARARQPVIPTYASKLSQNRTS